MDKQYIRALKQAIQERYERKYGPVTLHYEELVPETHGVVRIQYTVSKAEHCLKRYYGRAVYTDSDNDRNNHLYLGVYAM